MDALVLISSTDLFDVDQLRKLSDLTDDLRETVETAQVFRTRTEMEVSVLNDVKRPTPDAKYWQAVREQDVMLTELTYLSYEYRKNELEMQKLRRRYEVELDDLERQCLALEVERRTFQAGEMRRTAAHRLRELQEWANLKAMLRPHLKYGDQDVNAHQLEAFNLRFQAEAALVTEHTPLADARNVYGLAIATRKRLEGGDG